MSDEAMEPPADSPAGDGIDVAGYRGPDRRRTSDLRALRASVEGLRNEVKQLNTSLEAMNQQHEEDEAWNAGWRGRATTRVRAGWAVTLLGFAALGVLFGLVVSDESNTSAHFSNFRQQIVENCYARNQEADGTRAFIIYLESLVKPSDDSTRQAIDAFLQALPKDANCQLLNNA